MTNCKVSDRKQLWPSRDGTPSFTWRMRKTTDSLGYLE